MKRRRQNDTDGTCGQKGKVQTDAKQCPQGKGERERERERDAHAYKATIT